MKKNMVSQSRKLLYNSSMIHSTPALIEMDVYLVVEGNGEKRVYEHWVPLVNPKLRVVNSKPLLHDRYYERVKKRLEETGHIASFEGFLGAFV